MTAEPIAPPRNKWKVSTVATNPARAEIDADLLAGVGVRTTAAKYGTSVPALFAYARKLRHAPNTPTHPTNPHTGNLAPLPNVSITVDRARRLMREAERHMKEARASGDIKAANGAISSATKAIELFGKATGQLQSNPQVTLQLTQVQTQAVDLHAAASRAPAPEISREAGAWLAAQLEAGEPEAMRIVARLMRLLPMADATDPGGTPP